MNTFTRRDALRWTGSVSIASTFLPMSGRYCVWSHPAGNNLLTRPLGRTGREVTTFGLAGGNKVMWDLPGDEGHFLTSSTETWISGGEGKERMLWNLGSGLWML